MIRDLDYFQPKKIKTATFQVRCHDKAGQGHRIESIAWYAQTIVYYTIFPNKNVMKWLLRNNCCIVIVLFLSLTQFSFKKIMQTCCQMLLDEKYANEKDFYARRINRLNSRL